jgi:hypothetical protein
MIRMISHYLLIHLENEKDNTLKIGFNFNYFCLIKQIFLYKYKIISINIYAKCSHKISVVRIAIIRTVYFTHACFKSSF